MAAAKIVVGVNKCEISGTQHVPWKEIDRVCSYMPKSAQFSKAFQDRHWDGIIHLYKNGIFPSGLLDRVLGILAKYDLPVDIISNVQYPDKRYPWYLKDGIIDQQRHLEAIYAVVAGKRGMVQLPTRFGKTTKVAAGTIATFGVPTLFVAHQLDLIYDAKEIFETFIEGPENIGVIGGGECTYAPITVGCIDTIAERLKTDYLMQKYIKEKVKYLLIDETQFYGPGQYKDMASVCGAPYRLFMSATTERNDGADIEIEAASGPMLYTLTEEAMIEEGYISDVDLEMIPFDHKAYNNKATGIKYPEFYQAFIVDNPERNELICNEVEKLVAEGNPTLVIVRIIEHGNTLLDMLTRRGLNVRFIYGDTAVDERRSLRARFNNGEFDVLIGSTIFDTAIDLHRASGLVLAASGSSKIRAPQRVGRVLSQIMGKVAKVKDIKDMNIKYFSEDAKDRQRVYVSRYGNSRVHVRGRGELSDLEKIVGIDYAAMFDSM